MLNSKSTPAQVNGKLYAASVRSSMTYSSETWALTEENQRWERAEVQMVRRMCGITLNDKEHRGTTEKVRCIMDVDIRHSIRQR